MAARYVNPTNVVAQGQDFYTGLPAQDQQKAGSGPGLASRPQQQAGSGPGLASGSYSGHGGGGGGNVMGRGSGGSAGVAADRTGSDSSKSWNYKPQLNIQIARDEEKNNNGTPPVDPTKKRPRQPEPEAPLGEIVEDPPYPPIHPPGVMDADWWETPRWEDPTGGLPSAERPQLTAGEEQPALPPGQPPLLQLGPGKKQPSQTPNAIRKRAKRASDREAREVHEDFVNAVNPATGGLLRTPYRNVSGPIGGVGPPKLGTPIGGAAGSRTNGRPDFTSTGL